MNAEPIDLCVLGPSGRMGSQVCRLALASQALRLVGAIERPGALAVGSSIENSSILVEDTLTTGLSKSRVYIDFTSPQASALAAKEARIHRTAAVVGTTGLGQEALEALRALSEVAPVFVASNFSIGVALLCHLAEKAAAALGPEYDLEVMEMHHRNKIDAPSGTALALGNALAAGRGLDFNSVKRLARNGLVGPRAENEIGIFSLRGGDIIGEHTALLIGDEERIEITHRAQRRSVFASGALRAAAWTSTQPPGLYDMSHLLAF